jgi:hypothetical protein
MPMPISTRQKISRPVMDMAGDGAERDCYMISELALRSHDMNRLCSDTRFKGEKAVRVIQQRF